MSPSPPRHSLSGKRVQNYNVLIAYLNELYTLSEDTFIKYTPSHHPSSIRLCTYIDTIDFIVINVRPFTHACDRQVTLSAAAAAAASSSWPRGHNTAARTIVAAAQINVPAIMCRENSHTNNNESGRRRSQHDPSRDARYHHQRNETTTRKCHTHVCVTPTPRVLRAIAFTSTITTYIDDDDDTNYVPYSQTALDDRLCVSVPEYGSSLSLVD